MNGPNEPTDPVPNPPAPTYDLAEMFHALRLYTGMSQRGLADHIGVARRTLQRIERGQDRCPPGFMDTMLGVVNAFDGAVDAVIEAARAAGGAVVQVTDGEHHAAEWERAVVDRAAVLTMDHQPAGVTPVLADAAD